MSHNLFVRTVTSADACGLAELWRRTWSSTYGPTLGPEALRGMLAGLEQQKVAAMLPGAGEWGYCAVCNTQIVGSVVIAERDATAYLWGMYVAPEHQRMGVGSRLLMVAAEGISISQRIELRVLAANPGAFAFYRKKGFRQIGEEQTEVIGQLKPTFVMAAAISDVLQNS